MTEIENPIEGKAALTRRLTREGRWGLASARKDEIAAELRASGAKRSESNAEAWRKMAQEFPSLPMADKQKVNQIDNTLASQAETIDPQTLAALPDSSLGDFEADVLWVLDRLACLEIDFTGAPSKASVGLYFWARRQPDRFMDRVVHVVCKAIAGRKPVAGKRADHGPGNDAELLKKIRALGME